MRDRRDLIFVSEEMYKLILDFAVSIQASDEKAIQECIARVKQISDHVDFVANWRKDRIQNNYTA